MGRMILQNLLGTKDFFAVAGVSGSKAEKRYCRAAGLPSPLLLVPQRCNAYSEHICERLLKFAGFFADCLHIDRCGIPCAGRIHFVPADFDSFLHAFHKIVEHSFFHYKASLSRRRQAFFAVKSPCSFLVITVFRRGSCFLLSDRRKRNCCCRCGESAAC